MSSILKQVQHNEHTHSLSQHTHVHTHTRTYAEEGDTSEIQIVRFVMD